jgi:hypothetical protein
MSSQKQIFFQQPQLTFSLMLLALSFLSMMGLGPNVFLYEMILWRPEGHLKHLEHQMGQLTRLQQLGHCLQQLRHQLQQLKYQLQHQIWRLEH